MICLYCSEKTTVTNSRRSKKSYSTWRRRQCISCQAVYTSRESPDYERSLRVRSGSSSNALSPFLRDKLFISVYTSLSHRKTALSDASSLTDTITAIIMSSSHAGIIKTAKITLITGNTLSKFDKLAAAHYLAQRRLSNE